ncbi:MAG: hypothetical protein PHN98_07125, partial [Smithellaceae bacterium]|nr:hypothetical protein [Smithellaceae bacterium]
NHDIFSINFNLCTLSKTFCLSIKKKGQVTRTKDQGSRLKKKGAKAPSIKKSAAPKERATHNVTFSLVPFSLNLDPRSFLPLELNEDLR